MTVRRALVGTALAVLASGLLAGCVSSNGGGSSAGSSGAGTETTAASSSLAVSPAHPTVHSPIAFAFTAPTATGAHGTEAISYSLSITGPAGAGCVGVHEALGPSASSGEHVSVSVGPTQLGDPWCAGAYTARALELARAVCKGTAPCPQYIRVVAIVARTSFAITTS